MFRDNRQLVVHPKVGFMLHHGALGDTISSLPALNFARAAHAPVVEMVVWTREDLVPLIKLLCPGFDVRTLYDFKLESEAHGGKLPYPYCMNSSVNNTITRNKQDMVDFAFRCLLDLQPPFAEAMNYPSAPLGPRPANLDVKYVALAPNGNALNRTLPATVLGPVIEGLLARGLRPVMLGKREASVPVAIQNGKVIKERKSVNTGFYDDLPEALRAQCVDLRERTNTLEARDILGHAEAVIGLDGGLLHLAGTTEVPIVYGITSVDPAHRHIYRHGEPGWKQKFVQPPESLACRGCQSHWTLVFGLPFTECAYGDTACATLNPDEFLSALDQLTAPTGG